MVVVLPMSVEAVLITKRVTIQPIRVNSDSTGANLNGTIFEQETDKIWAQAGIDVEFLPIVNITQPSFLNLSSSINDVNSLHVLSQMSGNGASADPAVLNLWFVQTIDNNPSALGFSLQTSLPFGTLREKNGMAIADGAFSYAGGLGMRDIFAHELGHNLGLYHGTDENGVEEAVGELNLMSRTSTFPTSEAEIYPQGNQLGQLNSYQINERVYKVSPYVKDLPANEQYNFSFIPEPSTYGMAAGAALVAFGIVRRKTRQRRQIAS